MIDMNSDASKQEPASELSEEQLSVVSGGKGKAPSILFKACATGEHFKQVTIDFGGSTTNPPH